MSMGMSVVGIPERDYFDKMAELKEKCEELRIEPPKEVKEFFGNMWEEKREILEYEVLIQKIPHRKWSADMSEGFEIDVKDIPDNIKTIRFFCSW